MQPYDADMAAASSNFNPMRVPRPRAHGDDDGGSCFGEVNVEVLHHIGGEVGNIRWRFVDRGLRFRERYVVAGGETSAAVFLLPSVRGRGLQRVSHHRHEHEPHPEVDVPAGAATEVVLGAVV